MARIIPSIKQLNGQIKALDKRDCAEEQAVVNKAKDAYGIAHAAEDQAKGVLDNRVHELYGQRDDIVKYELLTEEYESNRHMYESILARLREAAVDAGPRLGRHQRCGSCLACPSSRRACRR